MKNFSNPRSVVTLGPSRAIPLAACQPPDKRAYKHTEEEEEEEKKKKDS
jgi:hypothetical protein